MLTKELVYIFWKRKMNHECLEKQDPSYTEFIFGALTKRLAHIVNVFYLINSLSFGFKFVFMFNHTMRSVVAQQTMFTSAIVPLLQIDIIKSRGRGSNPRRYYYGIFIKAYRLIDSANT